VKRHIDSLDVHDRRVFVRIDANVPLAGSEIRDDTRLRAIVPTITNLRSRGARVILASHLGRPAGRWDPALSLKPVAERLSELISCEIRLAPDSVGHQIANVVADLNSGEVLLLENLRFHVEEEQNDPTHATELADLADQYVNDAFGTAHRAHASTVGIPQRLPSAAGPLVAKEIAALERITKNPERPFVAIVGGAKTSDKIGVLKQLAAVTDALILGGGLANTFLANNGETLGLSLVEPDQASITDAVYVVAAESGCRILLPSDGVIARVPDPNETSSIVCIENVPSTSMVLDIGPESSAAFSTIIKSARTVIWNGPVGVYEHAAFANGSLRVARALAESPAFTVVAGGDALAVINSAGVADQISHLCTGGGAALEFIEGRMLPGIEILPDA
jgi:phosphoglycerate kinase